MSTDLAIHVEGLGKRYLISHNRERYVALRDVIVDSARRAVRRAAHPFRSSALEEGRVEELYALRDVNLEVHHGDRLGVIGRNGAGKSTLLKILSRITDPSEGRVTLRGRVASLLEVGTGFHPELTGRENVYLNGAILGMGRAEVRRKFDEIVDFAEVERFLDTPVKRYSSGMYVRLAFAVAAHLEPEILLVDEVLAVGDAAFQQKCLGKMSEVARGGRTVILVSHNMVAIEELAATCLWLHDGGVRAFGAAPDVVRDYTSSFAGQSSGEIAKRTVVGDGSVELLSYRVQNGDGETYPLPRTGEDVLLFVRLRLDKPMKNPACGLSIWNDRGMLMTSINSVQQGLTLDPWPGGEIELEIRLSKVAFLAGRYHVDFWVMTPEGQVNAQAEGAIAFEIAQSAIFGGTDEVTPGWGSVYTDVRYSQPVPVAEIGERE